MLLWLFKKTWTVMPRGAAQQIAEGDNADIDAAPAPPSVRASRPPSQLVLTEKGERSRFWRMMVRIYARFYAFSIGCVVVGVSVCLSATVVPVRAAETPKVGAADFRVRDVDYDPDQVVVLSGAFRHAVEIQFGQGEKVSQVALGDTVSWQIAPVDNVIFLKPREKAQDTNLIVLTQTAFGPRTYHFQLTMQPSATIFAVRFRYPGDAARIAQTVVATQAALKTQSAETGVMLQALDHAVIEGQRNFRYTKQGDDTLAPTEISDNGEFTVLRYPGHADIPSIFAVNGDGAEEIVPFDIREDFVVIHAVYRQLRLRRGQQVLCIWNEAPPRNDRALRTGTVSNVVERVVKPRPADPVGNKGDGARVDGNDGQ